MVSRREGTSEKIDFENYILDPKDNAHRVNGPAIETTCLNMPNHLYYWHTLDKCPELLYAYLETNNCVQRG